jgi:hypothetical protein
MTEKPKFERGTALSIFKTDRAEDLAALVVALVIAALVVMFVPK